MLNKCANPFAPCNDDVTFGCVIIDAHAQHPIGCKYSKKRNKMTPKEVIEKTYECFVSGDMKAFTKLHTPDYAFIMNDPYQLSGAYNRMAAYMERMMLKGPTVFPLNFCLKENL